MERDRVVGVKKFADRLVLVLVIQTVTTIGVLLTMCYWDAYVNKSPARPRLLDLVTLESAILVSLLYGWVVKCNRSRKQKLNASQSK